MKNEFNSIFFFPFPQLSFQKHRNVASEWSTKEMVAKV